MKRFLLLSLAITTPLSALTIQIDYTYDTTNFFNTQAKRDAMEAVARFYGDMITDNLLRIDVAQYPGNAWIARPFHPVTGLTVDIPNLVVPEDTIIVYVGARNLDDGVAGVGGPGGFGGLTSGWSQVVRGRGSAAAANSNPALNTDFSPWGGSIAFDLDRPWNFSLTQNLAGTEFITIALHEMGHVLGVGTAHSWINKISSTVFTGSASTRSYGANPQLNGSGHFGGAVTTSRSFGSFNVTHGTNRQVLMLATLTDNNSTLVVASDLDLAALMDIGWQISPQYKLTTTALGPAGASFTWNTSSFFDYRLERGTTLTSFPGGNTLAAGNGSIRTWTDPSPPAGKAFYRLARTEVFAPPAIPPSSMAAARGFLTPSSEEPRVVNDCGHSGH